MNMAANLPNGAIVLACSVEMATLISLTLMHGNPTWGRSELVSVPLVLTLLGAVLAWLTRLGFGHFGFSVGGCGGGKHITPSELSPRT
jgi:hypothetical protein